MPDISWIGGTVVLSRKIRQKKYKNLKTCAHCLAPALWIVTRVAPRARAAWRHAAHQVAPSEDTGRHFNPLLTAQCTMHILLHQMHKFNALHIGLNIAHWTMHCSGLEFLNTAAMVESTVYCCTARRKKCSAMNLSTRNNGAVHIKLLFLWIKLL